MCTTSLDYYSELVGTTGQCSALAGPMVIDPWAGLACASLRAVGNMSMLVQGVLVSGQGPVNSNSYNLRSALDFGQPSKAGAGQLGTWKCFVPCPIGYRGVPNSPKKRKQKKLVDLWCERGSIISQS